MRSEIISNLSTTLEAVFGVGKVFSDKINLKSVGDALGSVCFVALNRTRFNSRGQGNMYTPELEIDLVLFVPRDSTPLSSVFSKEDEVITALLADPTRGGRASNTVLEVSSASNIVEKYQSLGEVSSVLRITVSYALNI